MWSIINLSKKFSLKFKINNPFSIEINNNINMIEFRYLTEMKKSVIHLVAPIIEGFFFELSLKFNEYKHFGKKHNFMLIVS